MIEENADLSALLKEIEAIVSADTADDGESLELVKVKLAEYLAHHPAEAAKLSTMLETDFVRRRTEQLIQEIE
jgi:hypothetical protein